jgi:hypothetical protein
MRPSLSACLRVRPSDSVPNARQVDEREHDDAIGEVVRVDVVARCVGSDGRAALDAWELYTGGLEHFNRLGKNVRTRVTSLRSAL